MKHDVIIIGAGMGGLTAAIRLAQLGRRVTVLEARDRAGGLAAGLELEGFSFDAGPYVLLDRPGLEWAFRRLNLELADQIALHRIDDVYEVHSRADPTVLLHDSLDRTAEEIERQHPGAGVRYRAFIQRMQSAYSRLQPLQWVSRPNLRQLIKTGAWREVWFLSRSLRSVLASTRLPAPIVRALGIWTHVAGQTMREAPSPLAMTPALIHGAGAYYPENGIGAIPAALFRAAQELDIAFHFNLPVRRICCQGGAATGVETAGGDFHPATAVLSNVGLGTYLKLLPDDADSPLPSRIRGTFRQLPLQSPGVCVYLAAKGRSDPPYLRFQLRDEPDGCRLLVAPSALPSAISQDGWFPARLIAPMHHHRAQAGGEPAQRAFLDKVLAEDWWRKSLGEVRILATRIPRQWGDAFHLYGDSMNPVMTSRFMWAGRLAHRSPWIRNLYLTGSATHPGQWVSFCGVSGILTADQLHHDLSR